VRFRLFFLFVASVLVAQVNEEDFFEDVKEAPLQAADHQKSLLEQNSWRLGGVLKTRIEPVFFWKDLDWLSSRPDDAISLQFQTDFYLDARPDRNNRVYAKVRTAYPYNLENSVKIFELFTDFRLTEELGFRFGKQVATWGYSRFYQIADVFSLEPKDPANPTAELEGPFAFKTVWTPVDALQTEGLLFLKPAFVSPNQLPRAEHLGYALRLRALLPWGGETLLGGFYQKDLSPRLIVGAISALPGLNVQVFSDGVFSWGSDRRFVVGQWPLLSTEKRTQEWFASATAGLMYQHRDWKMTLYAEYLFQSWGSDRSDYLGDLVLLYGMEQMLPANQRTLTPDDLRLPYRHYASGFVQWTDLFEIKRLGFSVLGLMNFIEPSATVEPALSWGPTDQILFQGGVRLAWGKDDSEFVLRQNKNRLSVYLQARLGVQLF